MKSSVGNRTNCPIDNSPQQPIDELQRLRVWTSWYLHDFILPLTSMNANIDTLMFLSSGRGGIDNKYAILIGLNRVRGCNVRGAKRPILLFSTGNPSISALAKSTRTSQLLTKKWPIRKLLCMLRWFEVYLLEIYGGKYTFLRPWNPLEHYVEGGSIFCSIHKRSIRFIYRTLITGIRYEP